MNPDPLSRRMPRADSLTGLRWWAAFAVFTYHMLNFAPLPEVAAVFLRFGYFGVTFFFILSGFVLTWSASAAVRQSTFYWRRLARVYPAHLVALAVAIPVFYSFTPDPLQDWVKPVDVGILALSVVLLQGWWRDPVILFSGNPAAWTLTVEAFFYAIHPYVMRVLGRLRVRGSLLLAGATLLIGVVYHGLARLAPGLLPTDVIPQPILHVGEFIIGMAIAWAIRCGWRIRIHGLVGIAALLLAFAIIALTPRLLPGSALDLAVAALTNEIVIIACVVALVAYALRDLDERRSLLAHPLLVRLGEWSFAFYLVHATIIYTALAVFGHQYASWRNLAWYAAMLVLSIAGAAALHLLVEKPVERRMRAWKDARDARRSATP